MQMMPATSCSQRIAGRGATAEDSTRDISRALPTDRIAISFD
jgi:hypothetical protein